MSFIYVTMSRPQNKNSIFTQMEAENTVWQVQSKQEKNCGSQEQQEEKMTRSANFGDVMRTRKGSVIEKGFASPSLFLCTVLSLFFQVDFLCLLVQAFPQNSIFWLHVCLGDHNFQFIDAQVFIFPLCSTRHCFGE